jgi:peptidyl-prolyl cis-trans isomerase C
MKISNTLINVLTVATLAFAPAAMADSNLATVNGKAIKQSIYDYIAKDAKANGQKINDNVKKAITNKLIDSEIVAQEATKLGLDKKADFITREALARRELLTSAYLQDFMKKNPISDSAMKAEYKKYTTAYGAKEYKGRHILVKTEGEAKDIIAKLAKGGDFAKLAKAHSLDQSNKNKGGNLEWFSPTTMVKPFSEAAAKVKKGTVSKAPVQTQFGWHVIKIDDTRKATPQPYDKLKPNLKKKLQQMQLEKKLGALRSKAKVTITK